MNGSFSKSYIPISSFRARYYSTGRDDSMIIFWGDTSKIWSKRLKYAIIYKKNMRESSSECFS